MAVGALALGALAIGALAIGAPRHWPAADCSRRREEVHLGTVEIDDLTVRRLHVIEEKPSASRESDAG